ncbi:MAG TPA: DUF29 domain-containing protein [Fimbriiglobus sp.]|nr:DUF29 domain-containing protein [Fimbriiglobus sp.]
MIRQPDVTLADLYESDETAWLDATADLIRRGAYRELDYAHLEEYLTDMARRDRREVESRLVVLIAHILKWVYQPDQRTRGWQGTIVEQRQELSRLAARGVLRKHAEAVLAEMYAEGVERAVAETGLPAQSFPAGCPHSLEQLLSFDPAAE